MSFLNEMNRRDGALAGKARDAEDRLRRVEAEVVRARQILEMTKQSLERDRGTLRRRMAESRTLLAELHQSVEQIQYEISRIRPLAVCPVAGPHAIADDFGILHHHSKKEGGTHVHQGNDITAAMGTPIVAPFDGVAVTTSNEIGGLAVKVSRFYARLCLRHDPPGTSWDWSVPSRSYRKDSSTGRDSTLG